MSNVEFVAEAVLEDSNQELITSQYRYIKELAILKYDAEEKREINLLQQSSQMQTAFSFMTAALFMAVPICIEHRGAISLEFFLVSVSIVTALLMASLICASIAQWRWKTETFPDIKKIKDEVINNPEWEKLCIEYHQVNQWIDLVGSVQSEKARLNDRRVGLIITSMICFYGSIGTLVVCFFIGIAKLF